MSVDPEFQATETKKICRLTGFQPLKGLAQTLNECQRMPIKRVRISRLGLGARPSYCA